MTDEITTAPAAASYPDPQRLDRIEQKLDKLAEAVVSLARMEERMSSLLRRIDYEEEQTRSLASRLQSLEKTSVGRGNTFAIVDKVFWVVLAGAISFGFFALRGTLPQ